MKPFTSIPSAYRHARYSQYCTLPEPGTTVKRPRNRTRSTWRPIIGARPVGRTVGRGGTRKGSQLAKLGYHNMENAHLRVPVGPSGQYATPMASLPATPYARSQVHFAAATPPPKSSLLDARTPRATQLDVQPTSEITTAYLAFIIHKPRKIQAATPQFPGGSVPIASPPIFRFACG